MEKLTTLNDIESFTQENSLALIYISQPGCSVCHSLLPQVENLLQDYPRIKRIHVDASEVPEIAGKYSIFTVPVVLLFSEGKELYRKARFVPIEELNQQLAKYYQLIR